MDAGVGYVPIIQSEEEEIQFREKVAYGLGDAANNVLWTSVGTFMLFFFTDVAGLTMAVAGLILLWARVIDGFIDIVVGSLVDRTITRFGKARPWILWMTLPFGIFTVMLYTVPNIGMSGKIVYYAIAYFVINIVYSCMNIPYGTLNSLITQDQHQRQVLNNFRAFMAIIMSLTVSVGTTGFVSVFGNGAKAWQITFVIYAIVAVILYSITFFGTKERVKIVSRTETGIRTTNKKRIISIFKNKYLWLIFVIQLTLYLSQGMSSVNIYYAKYIFGDESKTSILMLATLAPMMLTIFICAPLIKKWGKRNFTLAGCLISIIGFLILMIGSDNYMFVLVGSIIKSLGMAPMAATTFPMVFDAIEYGEWKTGVRSEGLSYSMSSVAQKLGSAGGSALVAMLLSIGGYVAGAATQNASTIFFIKASFIYVQFVLVIVTIILLFFYKIDKLYPTIMEELETRRGLTTK